MASEYIFNCPQNQHSNGIRVVPPYPIANRAYRVCVHSAMRISSLLPLVALAACMAWPQSSAQIQRLDGSRISIAEASMLARKALEANHVTGAEIAVVNRGKLVWSEGFGLRRANPDLPMNRTTTTWAASITKSVFAAYVMQLVERGEIDLDKPVAQQLAKPLDAYEPYQDTASELVKDPLWPAITPRMLLSHSSGLANFAFIEPDKKMHLHFKPGTQFLYSGEGINLVQFVVEQKFHKPLDVLMQQAIFDPLGMVRTGLIYRTEFADDVADRFDMNASFHAQTRRFPARAAGSMTTSVDDLTAFAIALLNGRIMKPATRKQMLHPVLFLHGQHQFPLPGDKGASVEADSVGLAYGTGWGLLTRTRFGPAFFKEGHGDGAQNYMICFEHQKSCMIVLTNSDNGELAFRTLFEGILGDTVTPWEWEGYTPSYIEASRAVQ
jgi:CubicO group peptidase (beta-lactamase class C family)